MSFLKTDRKEIGKSLGKLGLKWLIKKVNWRAK